MIEERVCGGGRGIPMRRSEGVSHNHIDKSCHYSLNGCYKYLKVR